MATETETETATDAEADDAQDLEQPDELPPGADDEIEAWVLNAIDELTEPVPEGQDAQSPLWTSERRLRSDGEKFTVPYPKQDVSAAINRLRNKDEILAWVGLLAPMDPEHLRAIIQAEMESDVPRRLLVTRAQTCLQGGQDE